MDTHTHPGGGLSLSQLVFALNRELKRVAYSPLYVAKVISVSSRNKVLTTSEQLHFGGSLSTRSGCFNRISNHSRVEELIRSH